jgi:hypothetical protein
MARDSGKPKPRQPRPLFHYQSRTDEQWRALTRRDVPPGAIGRDLRWLRDLLRRAADADRYLTPWQSGFIEDLTGRLATFGPSLFLSPRQRAALVKIELQIGGRRVR